MAEISEWAEVADEQSHVPLCHIRSPLPYTPTTAIIRSEAGGRSVALPVGRFGSLTRLSSTVTSVTAGSSGGRRGRYSSGGCLGWGGAGG